MIKNTKQNWQIGEVVKVGFMKNLEVMSMVAIKDSLPDIYLLKSLDSGSFYEFIPHNGLTKV